MEGVAVSEMKVNVASTSLDSIWPIHHIDPLDWESGPEPSRNISS